MLPMTRGHEEIRGLLAGIALGMFLALLGVLLWFESNVEPKPFECPRGLQIVIGNQALLHKPDSPTTRNCNIVPAP